MDSALPRPLRNPSGAFTRARFRRAARWCPCRGSGFDDRTGAVLNGSASAPLDSVDGPW